MKKESETSLILLDILRGFSKISYKNDCLYLKHFVVYDDLHLSEMEAQSYNSAIKMGVKNEEALLKNAIEKKFWSKEEEETIKNLEWVIDKSNQSLSKVSDWNLRKSLQSSIKLDEDKLDALKRKKHSIVSHSAESFASRKRNTKTLLDNVFVDEAMKTQIDEDDLFDLMPLINQKVSQFIDVESIVKAAFDPYFFDLYSLNESNPMSIFNKDIYTITIWQKNLIVYASILLNKLKNMDIPASIREDPVKIYKYQGQAEQKTGENVVHGVEDLKQKMKQKDGKLSAEDF
tara:strand:- start:61 stop:927 length:867 start_codon:yes stop_codon:yes gene_type:complete